MTSLADTNLLYREPHLYDALFSGDAGRAELVLRLIATHGPATASTVLDLGCGTGRDLADLAAMAPHLAVTGIDLQPGMIAHGRRVRPHLDLRAHDLRTIRLGGTVDVIVCLGNTLAYLHTAADLDAAFTTFAAHAHPGTLLVIQTLFGTPITGPPRTSTVRLHGTTAQVTTATDYDPRTRIATTRRSWAFPDGRHASDHIRRRALTPDELHAGLDHAGFRLHTLSGDPTTPAAAPLPPTAYAVAELRP